MDNKSYYINIERILTFSLFLPILFLFPSKIIHFKVFLFSGIIIGALVSYVVRDRFKSFVNFVPLPSIITVILWMLYNISKSTFFYKDVVIICIEAVAILLVIFSFISYAEGYYVYIELFALVLFLCICSLIISYDRISIFFIASFIFCILAIIRVKFLVLFTPSIKSSQRISTGDVFFLGLIFLTIFLAWILLVNIPFGKIKVWGMFQEEVIGQIEEQEKLENENSSLAEDGKIQDELTGLALKLESTDEMHKGIELIGYLLVKDAPNASEVALAENGLENIVYSPALDIGVDRRNGLSSSIKKHVNKKLASNFNKLKTNTVKVIENNQIGLWQRANILGAMNKLEYANSLKEIEKHGEQLKAASNNPVISNNVSKQLNQYGREFKEWKLLQLYRSKFSNLLKKVSTLPIDDQGQLNSIVSKINVISKISESRSIRQEIKEVRDKVPAELKEYLDQAEGLLNFKKTMILTQDARELREKLAKLNISPYKLQEIEKYLNTAENSNNINEITKAITEFIGSLQEEGNANILKEMTDLIQAKIDSVIDKLIDSMNKEILNGKFKDSGQNLLKELKEMTSETEKGKASFQSKKINRLLEEHFKQGEITGISRDNLIRETGELERLSNMKLELSNQIRADNLLDKVDQFDYNEKLADLLQNSSLGDDQKEIIDKLTEKLETAISISQIEEVLEAINREVESATTKWDKADVKEVKELIEKLAEAKKILLQESAMKNQQKELMNKLVDKLISSQTISQIGEVQDALDREKIAEELYKDKSEGGVSAAQNDKQGILEKKDVISVSKQREAQGEVKESKYGKVRGLISEASEAKKILLQSSSLKYEQRDLINKLMVKLESAISISQIEEVLEVISREVESATIKWDKADVKKVKEFAKNIAEARKLIIFEQASAKLRMKIEDIKSILPLKGELLEKNLNKLKEVEDSSELSQALLVFNQIIESGKGEEYSTKVTPDKSRELKVYLVPNRVILPVGSIISLKSITVYKNKQVRDLNSGLEWVSSNPNVVFVDQNGLIRTVSKGSVEITAQYRSAVSAKCLVVVVGGISETEQASIINVLGK